MIIIVKCSSNFNNLDYINIFFRIYAKELLLNTKNKKAVTNQADKSG